MKHKQITLEDARRHSLRQGWDFFRTSYMSIFKIQTESPLYAGGYFICSFEHPDNGKRYFRLFKYWSNTGEVTGHPTFRTYCTWNGAFVGLKNYLKELIK